MALKKPSEFFKVNKISSINEEVEKISKDLQDDNLEEKISASFSNIDGVFSDIQRQLQESSDNKIKVVKDEIVKLYKVVDNIVENDIPKYKKHLSTTELRVESRIKNLKDELCEHLDCQVKSTRNKIEELYKETLDEELFSARKFVKDIYRSEIQIAVEKYVSTYSEDIVSLREELLSEIKKRPKTLVHIETKLEELSKKYRVLSENLNNIETNDPLLNTNPITLEQLKTHYQILVGRLQEQLASLGGGGEVRLEFLDDVDRNSAKVNGKFLKYDSSVGKWIGADASGGVSDIVDDLTPQLGGDLDLNGSDITGTGNINITGDARIAGILTVGTGSVTINGNDDSITIGNNLTITSSGNAEYSGVVTATSFSGDGSNLTGVITSLNGYATEAYVDLAVAGVNTFTGAATSITATQIVNWDTAYSWGDHSIAGYVTSISLVGYATEGYVDNAVSGVSTFSGDYADLTNKPTIPSDTGDLTNNVGFITAGSLVGYATETFVNNAVANLVDSAPSTLDTLNELASALGDDPNFATTITTSLGNKANLSGASFSGVVTATSFVGDGSNLTGLSTFSGDYADLTNKPTIPSDTGDLTNNVGFITAGSLVGYATEGYVDNAVVGFVTSGIVVGYATEGYVDNAVVGFVTSGIVDGYATEVYVNNALVGYATETFVNNAVANLVDSAPGTLDTLNELAAALGDDPNFATTITTSLGNKANLSGASFTGITTISQLNVTGISTLGVTTVTDLTAQQINVSGIVTATRFESSSTGTPTIDSPNNININAVNVAISTDLTVGRNLYTSDFNATGNAEVSGIVTATTFAGSLTGNSTTATSLQTARTFEITGDVVGHAVSFDGTGNVSIAATIQPDSVTLGQDTTGIYVASISGTSGEIEVSGSGNEQSSVTIGLPDYVTVTGINASGIVTATTFTGDVIGNATSATVLQTSRNIGGVLFNGSSDIDLPGVNLPGNQPINTSGVITATTFSGSGASLTSIPNGALNNSSVSYGGVSLALGGTDATPAFDLSDATNYPYTSLTGITTEIVGDTTPQLGGNLDLNSKNVTGTGNFNVTGVITATTFVKSGGTSSQFLKADGTVDSNTYLTAEAQTLDGVLTLGNTSSNGMSVGVVTASSFIRSGGTSSQFLKADGTVDSSTYLTSALQNVVEDTSPQLGGNLDLNSNDITGTGNINITGSVEATGVSTFSDTVNIISSNVYFTEGFNILTPLGHTMVNLGSSSVGIFNRDFRVSNKDFYVENLFNNDRPFFVDNTGSSDPSKVGINSSTPRSELDVRGNLIVSGISTLGVTTVTDLTAQQINVTGVSTIGVSNNQIIFTTDGGLGAIQSASSSGLKIQRGTTDTININTGQVTITNHDLSVNDNSRVGSAIAMYGATGIVSATQFVGDGSGLTNIVSTGVGVQVQNEGSPVGTAATINFTGSLIDATLSNGVATVSVSGVGTGTYAFTYGTLTTLTTNYAVTGLVGNIKPTSASSKVMVTVTIPVYMNSSNVGQLQLMEIALTRYNGSQDIIQYSAYAGDWDAGISATARKDIGQTISFSYLDSPASASNQIYKIYARAQNTNGNYYVFTALDFANTGSLISKGGQMTLEERS